MTSSYSAYQTQQQSFAPSKYINYAYLESTNPESICTIQTYKPDYGGENKVSGILDPSSTFGLSASAEYKDYMSNLKSFQEIQQYIGLAGSLAGNNNLRPSQVSLQSLRLSEQNYMGSSIGNLSVKFSIPIVATEDNPWTIATTMLAYVVGERTNAIDVSQTPLLNKMQTFTGEVEKELLLYAPHRYRVDWSQGKGSGGAGDEPHGCATIWIGTRFTFKKVLITNVSCTFSNYVYRDGKCTNLDIQVSFKPWRMPDMFDVEKWFGVADRS